MSRIELLIVCERSMNWILCGGLGLGISFP
jgi:hypothetical protein